MVANTGVVAVPELIRLDVPAIKRRVVKLSSESWGFVVSGIYAVVSAAVVELVVVVVAVCDTGKEDSVEIKTTAVVRGTVAVWLVKLVAIEVGGRRVVVAGVAFVAELPPETAGLVAVDADVAASVDSSPFDIVGCSVVPATVATVSVEEMLVDGALATLVVVVVVVVVVGEDGTKAVVPRLTPPLEMSLASGCGLGLDAVTSPFVPDVSLVIAGPFSAAGFEVLKKDCNVVWITESRLDPVLGVAFPNGDCPTCVVDCSSASKVVAGSIEVDCAFVAATDVICIG